MARVSTQQGATRQASTQPQQKNQNHESNVAIRGQHHPLDLFRRQFDALFDSMWGGMLAPFSQDFGPARMWDFRIDENDKEIVVRAEIPGFEEKELDVRLEQNRLTIKAEKEQTSDGQQEYRSFFRAVTLPAGIDPDKVQAAYHNGVLELHVPRTEAAQAKRIPLQGQQAEKESTARVPAGDTANGAGGQQAKKEMAAK